MYIKGTIIEKLGSHKYTACIHDPIINKQIYISVFSDPKVHNSKFNIFIGRKVDILYQKERSYIVFIKNNAR